MPTAPINAVRSVKFAAAGRFTPVADPLIPSFSWAGKTAPKAKTSCVLLCLNPPVPAAESASVDEP
jgi:hypothetical protein